MKIILFCLLLWAVPAMAEELFIPQNIPIDEIHQARFDEFILEFLNDPDHGWVQEKTFPDGDILVQILMGIKLKRIETIALDIERYVAHLTFKVRRASAERAQFEETIQLQVVYFDFTKEGVLLDWQPFEPIDIGFLHNKVEI